MTDTTVFRKDGSEISFTPDGSINVKSKGDFTFSYNEAKVGLKPALTLRDYQTGAASTAIYPESAKVFYPALGLAGEAGEVANKVKKIIRDKGGVFTEEDRVEIRKELGDVLWYVAALARDLDGDIADIAQGNLDKLASRKARGALQGSGDNR